MDKTFPALISSECVVIGHIALDQDKYAVFIDWIDGDEPGRRKRTLSLSSSSSVVLGTGLAADSAFAAG